MTSGDLRCAALATLLMAGVSTDAAAWERPKAPVSPKMETCPEMGEGFIKVPGSGTCIRVSGTVRVEALHIGAATSYYPIGR